MDSSTSKITDKKASIMPKPRKILEVMDTPSEILFSEAKVMVNEQSSEKTKPNISINL